MKILPSANDDTTINYIAAMILLSTRTLTKSLQTASGSIIRRGHLTCSRSGSIPALQCFAWAPSSAISNCASGKLPHSRLQPSIRHFRSTPTDQEGDLDDLCKKHMELPPDEFAHGCSFLHQVALGNAREVKQHIFSRRNLVNFRDYDRRTPLHIAASEGHLEICKFLVDEGSRINRSDRWGGSPLDDAYRHKHTEVAEYLRSCGGSFGSASQATNLISAASEGDIEEVKTLLQMGDIDINKGDYDKRTALHLAAGEGHYETIEFLCKSGADVNVLDRWNSRPLDDAQLHGHEGCIDLLKSFGAKHGNIEASSMGREALLDLFEQFSAVRDGELSLDWHDVKDLLGSLGQKPTDKVVLKLFEAVDEDGNGLIDKGEFLDNSDLFLQGRPARVILVVGGKKLPFPICYLKIFNLN